MRIYDKEICINDKIKVVVPTVGEIVKNEDSYYGLISAIISTPYEMMVQLDDEGIDFTKIDGWQLFCMNFRHLKNTDTSMIFKDLDLSGFNTEINTKTKEFVLRNSDGVVIDASIHNMICKSIRKMLNIPKNDKVPGNEDARLYMIERARKKQKRARRNRRSMLEPLIVTLVNSAEFPYNYETVKDITIYQFYLSLNQIVKKVEFDNLMIGCYAGTVNTKEIDPKKLQWVSTDI